MSSSAENRIQLEISLRMVLTATNKDEIEAVPRPFLKNMSRKNSGFAKNNGIS